MAEQNAELIALTADIVSSMVSNNKVDVKDIGGLIQSTFDALSQAGSPAPEAPAAPSPAVSIKNSVKNDYIVCLEDGKKMKMLKRYLMTNYGMTPEQYRTKWKLPRDYPMTAPAYADQRRDLAKNFGLGRRKVEETVKAVAKPVRKAAKSVSDNLAAAREHLGGETPKPAARRGRPPKNANPA